MAEVEEEQQEQKQKSVAYFSHDFDWKQLEAKVKEEVSLKEIVGLKLADNDCQQNWDEFHGKHRGNFYKPRRYLPVEFPELIAPENAEEHVILDCGSGYGSSILTVLEQSPKSLAFAFDFSPAAIKILQTSLDSRGWGSDRCRAFVHDLTLPLPLHPTPLQGVVQAHSAVSMASGGEGTIIDTVSEGTRGGTPLGGGGDTVVVPSASVAGGPGVVEGNTVVGVEVEGGGLGGGVTPPPPPVSVRRGGPPTWVLGDGCVDAALLVFTLSALPPCEFVGVVKQLYRVLRPGGVVCFRDYGMYDLSMLRAPRRVAQHQYLRGEGTLSYFFSVECLRALFCQGKLLTGGPDVEAVGGDKKGTEAAESGEEAAVTGYSQTGGAGSGSGEGCLFEEVENEYCTVRLFNRRKGVPMDRVWIHGKFRKPLASS